MNKSSEKIRAEEIASNKFIQISKEESIFNCGKLMGSSEKKYAIIVENNEILGIVYGIDIIEKLNKGEISGKTKAKDLMIDLPSVEKDTNLKNIVSKMVEQSISVVSMDNKIIDKDYLLEYILTKTQ